MRKLIGAALLAFSAAPALHAADSPSIVGQYVEARTAEVFTGGCLMNSEGETGGREALMAWRIDQGQLEGVELDGLSVVAAVAADVNLGTRELGGVEPSAIRSVVYVDERADAKQRSALLLLARSLSNGFVGDVVAVKPVPIAFSRSEHGIDVRAGDVTVDVGTHMHHDVSCSAIQWFHPLSKVSAPTLGVTNRQAYTGSVLGRRWEQVDRRSSFYGQFRY